MKGGIRNTTDRSLPCGSQCYLFVNCMHATTTLTTAVRGSFHTQTTNQSMCRADIDLARICVCFETYFRNLVHHYSKRSFAVLKARVSECSFIPSDQ